MPRLFDGPHGNSGIAARYRTATALAGEPTAPVTLSGTLVKRNSYRPARRHAAASGAKSNSSPIANPRCGISRRCKDPTEGSAGTTSTEGLSHGSAATPESHRKRLISSLPASPALLNPDTVTMVAARARPAGAAG